MLPKLVCKIWKQLNENILTTIISDGSKTMHSQPRLKLPAERLPKLKNKNTSIRTKIRAITQFKSIFTSSPDTVKHRKKCTYLCTVQVSHICPLTSNWYPSTPESCVFCIYTVYQDYLLNNSINTKPSINQVLPTEDAWLILNYITEFDLVSSDITVLSYLSYLHFHEES